MHGKQSFTAEMLSEDEPQKLIRETFNVLNQPLKDLSVSQHIPEELTDALSENVFYFSGFKTYHELNEASKLLKDDNGGIKSFDRFAEDVKAINNTYNRNYLEAEYEFATASSQMAVKWKEIEKDGDRYDLQYRTANDGLVRPEHAALHGITLPPSDKFWDKYYPPNGWRCRCTAVQVRKGKYPESDSEAACNAGEKATTHIGKDGANKAQIFRFNPGKQKKIFPPKHPYLPKGCGKCEFNKLAYNPNSEKCRACKIISECFERQPLLQPKTIKEYENGGSLQYYPIIDTKTSDYMRIKASATAFAEQGHKVVITPKFDGGKFCPDYDNIYGGLKGTKYYGKCPDFSVDGMWYEHEGFITNNPKRAFNNMLNHGIKQSDRLVLEDCGLSDGYMLRAVNGRIKAGKKVSEIWIAGNGQIRLLYKN